MIFGTQAPPLNSSSVSYTHLDVYKRQPMPCMTTGWFLNTRSWWANFSGSRVISSATVSYTHLDVYKRQVQQPLPHQVVQAARAGNEDVHALFQGCDLRSLTHTCLLYTSGQAGAAGGL